VMQTMQGMFVGAAGCAVMLAVVPLSRIGLVTMAGALGVFAVLAHLGVFPRL
jgi:hypothetical protein